LKRKFAVIGLGRFGFQVAKTLAESGAEVIAIDTNRDLVQRIKDYVLETVLLDATEADSLRSVGVDRVDVAVVAMGRDVEASILTTAIVRNLGVGEIIARATSDIHAQILRLVGATRVVFPEADMAIRVANSLASNILDYIELSEDHVLTEIAARESFLGKSLKDLRLRNRYGFNVIAIKRRGEGKEPEKRRFLVPGPEDVIEADDVLVMVGPRDRLHKLRE
jgi:trk system potassium uptake protein TrkA